MSSGWGQEIDAVSGTFEKMGKGSTARKGRKGKKVLPRKGNRVKREKDGLEDLT